MESDGVAGIDSVALCERDAEGDSLCELVAVSDSVAVADVD